MNSRDVTTGLASARAALERPFSAGCVGRFRYAAAGVAALYFLRLACEHPFLSSSSGLLDHRQLPWFAWQPIFRQDSSDGVLRAWLGLGAVLSLAAARWRLAALAAYVVAVSAYRWNLAVLSVDDALAHLLLFWLTLLPEAPGNVVTVRGVVPRCILLNLSLIYLIAGLTKWASPMWREGSALYAVMLLPGSRLEEAFLNAHLNSLLLLNWLALLVEPLLAALPWMRLPWRKVWICLGVAMHLGILMAIDVPIANLACLAIYVLAWADDEPEAAPSKSRGFSVSERLAVYALGLLTLTMLGSALQPSWRASRSATGSELGDSVQKALYAQLWLLGLAQQYRLLDWIDERNVTVEVRSFEAGGWSAPSALPANLRLGLALSYLTPLPWQALAPTDTQLWRQRTEPHWMRLLGDGRPAGRRVGIRVRRVHPRTAGDHAVLNDLELTGSGEP